MNVPTTITEEEYSNILLKEYGIKVSSGYNGGSNYNGGEGTLFRLVTHLDIDDDDTDRAIHALLNCI